MASESKESYKLTTSLFGDQLEITAPQMGDIWIARASIAAIPEACPFCGAGFVPDFFVGSRMEDGEKKKFDVYKIVCTGPDKHELMLSRGKDNGVIFDNKKRHWQQPAKDGSGLIKVTQKKLTASELEALQQKKPATSTKRLTPTPAKVQQPTVAQSEPTPAPAQNETPENWPKDLGKLRRYLSDVCGIESTKHKDVAFSSTGKELRDLKPDDYALVIEKASEQPSMFRDQVVVGSNPSAGAMGKIDDSSYGFEDLDKN